MKQASSPIVQDLVFIGGGHTHAIALRMFGMKPLSGLRLTLITEASDTAYSGMLPGHVAGRYTREECHIDLRRLAEFANAQLYLDQAIGLDLANNRVLCASRPPVGFDLLSIDIGSTPTLPSVLGAADTIIPAKPVRQFLEIWDRVIESITHAPERQICLAIVGGGTGGVELALNIHHRLTEIFRAARQPLDNLSLHLFHRESEIMPSHNHWVRQQVHQLLTQRGIQLHLQEEVCEVQQTYLRCKSGLTLDCDHIFWVTQASAPEWLRDAGFSVDEDGFVLVDDTLRSLSHPHIFAAGDIATMVNHPRPKAGVFAVRQGKPLFNNLRRSLQNVPLQSFHPQTQYLSLIGTGDGSAIASRGAFGLASPLLWTWKDHIDRAFMDRFRRLPKMNPRSPHPSPPTPIPCAGCGAKVGSSVLERSLNRIRQEQVLEPKRDDILIGLDVPDDAAVVQVPDGMVMVQTIDYFPALINDPFVFGQIAANHALSDLFAMGSRPQSALAIAAIPYGQPANVEETLYQLLSGAIKVLQQSDAVLTGGHTIEGPDLAFGLSCNGLANPHRLLRKGGMQPGQALILTKAIGTGTLFAAQMQLKAKGHWIDRAVESMLLSNQKAATELLKHQATACTDVTGFGLVGHLLEMVRASGVAVTLNLEAIPVLEGALETVQIGIVSSLQPQNLQGIQAIAFPDSLTTQPTFSLLFDPQTSGGLLASVPADQADRILATLKQLGYPHSAIIGHTHPLLDAAKPITIAL